MRIIFSSNILFFIILMQLGILNASAQTYKVFFEPNPDVLPLFQAGDVNEYIKNEMNIPNDLPKYPSHAMVKFTITKTGKVVNGEIEQSSTIKEIDEQILSAIRTMPNWQPAKKNGKAIDVDVYIPISGMLHYNINLKKDYEERKTNNSIQLNDTIQKDIWDNKFETYPQFIGGKQALIDFIEFNTKYPMITVESNIGGYTVVQFDVSENGAIENIILVRGIDPASDKEAIRAVKAMPGWMPAKSNGKKISSKYQLSIFFNLEKAKKHFKRSNRLIIQ